MITPSTLWHTVRYLRPVQFYGRLWFRFKHPKPDLRPALPLRANPASWTVPASRQPSLIAPTTFRFLGTAACLDTVGWDKKEIDKLWRYNLHYFDDLNATGADERVKWHYEIIQRWVTENATGQGTGWEPYPVSLRMVNWIKWALAGNPHAPEILHSLTVQARWLSKRLEIHLMGNHLYANAKALLFAGMFFAGPEAENWLEKGFSLLRRETREQILPDGGQFERSPMYHAIALEDLLDIINITRTYHAAVPGRWRGWVAQLPEVARRMRIWLAAMCHPDHEIAFFNDAAMGIAPSSAELESYAQRLGLAPLSALPDGLLTLAESGYLRVHRNQMVALLDVAPIGPDYLPGHAHADTLSFELSLFGQRFLVNSGTSCYGIREERTRQRSTAAHNTVVLDGLNSSEVWSGFRVARRARPLGLEIRESGEAMSISCSHDGYRWLKGRPQHTRNWHFCNHELLIEDTVTGNFKQGNARFHLHPSITVGDIDPCGFTTELRLPTGQIVSFGVEGGDLRKEISSWHPEFGYSEPTCCLSVQFRGPLLRTRIKWE